MEEYLGLIHVMGFAVTIHENEKARIPFAEQAYSELKPVSYTHLTLPTIYSV